MTRLLYHLGRLCSRHHWPVIGLWAVVAIVLFVVAESAGERYSAIDATIVRCLLVPAVMVLLRGRAWWLPRWLARALPRISIEGDEYFAKRDRAAAQPVPKG